MYVCTEVYPMLTFVHNLCYEVYKNRNTEGKKKEKEEIQRKITKENY